MSPRLRAILVDCDNTIYPPETRFLEAGDRRICEFIAGRLGLPLDEADALRVRLWREYGTTARGLAEEFGVSPEEMCREALENLDFEGLLDPDPELARELRNLGLPLYLFTNSTETYARRVLAALGLSDVFAGVFAIAFLGWEGKPSRAAFERVERALPPGPGLLALADDNPRNLVVARELGWQSPSARKRVTPATYQSPACMTLVGPYAALDGCEPSAAGFAARLRFTIWVTRPLAMVTSAPSSVRRRV